MLRADQPLALYMAGAFANRTGKMGLGVLRYSPNPVAAIIAPEHAGEASLSLPGVTRDVPVVSSIAEAVSLGAKVLVLGIAPPGGEIPPEWRPILIEAVQIGLSIVNGLHEPLALRYPPAKEGQWVWDVRQEPLGLQPGTGAARNLPNKRLLTIGTDMAVGKMTAGLELWRTLRQRGTNAAFVATGQIGITITGAGVPLDAVRVDFAAGAIEKEVMRYAESEVVIVEGQGSIIHPGSTSTLPLIRGSVPTHFLLVHRAGMETLPRIPWVKVPPLREVIRLCEDTASACNVFDRPSTIGVALNCAHLSDAEAEDAVRRVSDETGLPCADPVRHGCHVFLKGIVPQT
ncbi:MAG: DUF1611 domain-containing protein [Fimbriimonadaceae bacterium]|nr:DUF1611 domain-containing protein [Fimbriimonadaceae bacterium]